jgi:hypothetical protein
MNGEDDFVELALRLKKIEFCATNPVLAPARGYLETLSVGSPEYEPTIDGMTVKLTRLPGRWMLTISPGPEPFEYSRLAELEERATRIKESFFGEGGRIGLRHCSVVLYFHSPDPLAYMTQNTITSSRKKDFTRSDVRPITYTFGSPGGGRQVKISVGGGPNASPEALEAYAWLRGNPHFREDHQVTSVELAFDRPFIRQFASGPEEGDAEPSLPGLLREMVCVTLGDEALPSPFIRVATYDSERLPNYRRKNSVVWERVRRIFLKAVREPTAQAGVAAGAGPRRALKNRLAGWFGDRG